MEHIVAQASGVASAGVGTDHSRELVFWLMFGCKFTNKVLEMLGPERVAHDENMVAVLQSLQKLEITLPEAEC